MERRDEPADGIFAMVAGESRTAIYHVPGRAGFTATANDREVVWTHPAHRVRADPAGWALYEFLFSTGASAKAPCSVAAARAIIATAGGERNDRRGEDGHRDPCQFKA